MLKEKFLEFGYTEEEYYEIRESYGVSNYSDETLLKKFSNITLFFLELGYTKEEVIKMTKVLPNIYGLSIENIKRKINDMVSLGYTKEEVIKMTKTLPNIYGYSIENIKQKINDMVSLGYTKEEVIKMTKTLPTIYGLSIENIKQKLDFYDSINMRELTVVNSKLLMQSVALSYARYKFYLSMGIEINMKSYRRLFINNKLFEKTYGITRQEILEKYNYDRYMEENRNGRTI